MTPEETIYRANKARQILEEPLLIDAFSIMEKDVIEMFVSCPERDREGLQLLQQHIRNVRKLRNILLGIIENGKLAEYQIKEKQSITERITSQFRR